MKTGWFKRTFGIRSLLAISGGLMLASAFPGLSVSGLAWVGPGVILFSALGASPGTAFRVGYLGGLAQYLVSLHWLLFIPFPLGAIAGWLALSAYLAFYPALWVWLCWKTLPVVAEPVSEGSLNASGELQQRPLVALVNQLFATSWLRRATWAFACAAGWVGTEMVMARFLSGFPWNFVGASQHEMLPLIQIARWTGIYGVSFVVVWFSVGFAMAILRTIKGRSGGPMLAGELGLPMVAVVGLFAVGMNRVIRPEPSSRMLEIALVQPSIPQTLIWDHDADAMRFEQLIELSRQALATKPELLVWPEAAVPNFIRYDQTNYTSIVKLLAEQSAWMILGADDADPRLDTPDPDDADFFNSSFILSPSGEFAGTYRKRRLVIFGEYVPLGTVLPFIKFLTPIQGSFTPGTEPVQFEIGKPRAKTAVLICFEDVFPHFVREYVQPDTDFLLNLTNNGWFGESAAQWQHAINAVFRAIENGLPLVRCANNGLTCWVDERGAMHDVYFPGTEDIYGRGFKRARIPLLPEGARREPTFYNRHGDVFGWACVGVTLLLGAATALATKKGGAHGVHSAL